jgi:diguanylate cyclase
MKEIIDLAAISTPVVAAVNVFGADGLAAALGALAAGPREPVSRRARRLRSAMATAGRGDGQAAVLALRRPVRELQRALHRAEQQRLAAVQACERQAAFMGVLAHELRAPLSPIRHAAALLATACSPAAIAFVSAMLERQTAYASRLVEDLLDLTRIRTGKLRMQRAVVDLREVMACAVQACRPGMEAKSQSLSVDVPARPVWVDGDDVRLAQIMNNLLGNASRYTPRSGKIDLVVRTEAQRVTVIVRDSGIGIAAKDLHRIFDPYFQQEMAVGLDTSGLGLGLSIVRDLVLAHGGRIAVHSDGLGCGSRFEISLALLPDTALAASAGTARAEGRWQA